MSSADAPAEPGGDAVSGVPLGGGWDGSIGALGDDVQALGTVAEDSTWQLTDDGLLSVLGAVDGAVAQLEATRLRLIAQIDQRGIATQQGATGTTALLRAKLRHRPRDAAKDTRLANDLPTLCPQAEQDLSAGAISKDHAHVITRTVRQLPDGLPQDDRDKALDTLCDAARRFDPADVARIARHLLAHLDPDGPEPEDTETKARARREFSWSRLDDGSVRLNGRLDPESAETLITALDPLAAPRPYTDTEGPDPRSAAQRRADALTTLAGMGLDSGELPTSGGERPHITVTLDYDTLREQLARAEHTGALPILEHVGPISPTTARRLACDAQIIPAVLGSAGQPLDVGRSQRLVTVPMRRALVARDHGCAFPGCDRPPGWCDAHHITHWADGGPTSLPNMILLCGHHHRRVHAEHWRIRIGDQGRPEFQPPTPHPRAGSEGAHHPDDWWRDHPAA